MKFKKVLSSLLAATMLFGSVTANAVTVESKDIPDKSSAAVESEDTSKRSGAALEVESSGTTATDISNGVILHAWCWSCATITANMDKIADAGYTAVQTSPMQMSYSYYPEKKLMSIDENGNEMDDGTDGAWWWQYQPTDQKLGNYQFFTNPNNLESCKDEYRAMCTAAHQRGVKIITDVVTNHTTSHYKHIGDVEVQSEGLDISSDLINAVNGYNNLFHTGTPKNSSGVNVDNANGRTIAFYDRDAFGKNYDRQHVINYMNGGLPDINTENHDYQAYVINYLNSLIELGCDGFRFDTAHRIGITGVDGTNYNFNESTTTYDYWKSVTGKQTVNGVTLGTINDVVVRNPENDLFIYGEMLKHENKNDEKYGEYLRITDDGYGYTLRNAIQSGSVTVANATSNSSNFSGNSIIWVESHDTYCNDHVSAVMTDQQIRWGWAIITARNNVGTPLFFSRPNNSSRSNYWGDNILGAVGNDEYFCTEVSEVNKFHNQMLGKSESITVIDDQSKIIKIDRGMQGTCIVNMSDSDSYVNAKTNMSVGKYIDSVSGGVFEVYAKSSQNYIKGHILAGKIAVIYKTEDAVLSASYTNREFSDTQQVTLSTNKPESTYSVVVDGQTVAGPYSFTNGQTITLGNEINAAYASKPFELVLSATGSSGSTVSERYYFTKVNDSDKRYIYFDNSSYNWSNVWAYMYANTGVDNGTWPGVQMTLDSTSGLYKTEVPYYLRNGYVIFKENNGSNRYPADGKVGLPINDTEKVFSYDTRYTDNAKWVEAAVNNELTQDGKQDVESYSYIYFLNNGGWSDDNIRISLWKDSKGESSGIVNRGMAWDDTLKCYYYKYDSAYNFDKVRFTDTSSEINHTDALTAYPGKIFVGNSSDRWVYADQLDYCTINFKNTSSWSNVHVYLWNDDTGINNNAWPGVPMTKIGTSSDYRFAYAFPQGENPYAKAIVNNSNGGDGNQTVNLTISDGENYFNADGAFNVNKTLNVTFKYYDYSTGSSSETPYNVNEECTAATSVTIKSNASDAEIQNSAIARDVPSAITKAVVDFKPQNQFDNYTFYGSQASYVQALFSMTDDRLSGTTFGSKINSALLGNHTNSFSKVNSAVTSLNSSDKWVTYVNGNTTVAEEDVLPDFSNVTGIEVWGFSMPKTYHVSFNYPTSAQVTKGDELDTRFFISGTNAVIERDCQYNELLDPEGGNITGNMKIPTGWKFDGWYMLNYNNNDEIDSYVKVSGDIAFGGRITRSMDLYAVFRENGDKPDTTESVSTLTNGVDTFKYNNTLYYRFNTLMNVFKDDPAKDVTDVSVIYVKLGSNAVPTSTDVTTIKSLAGNTSGTGNITLSGGSCGYVVHNYSSGFTLSSKDRLQFALKLTSDQIGSDYSNVIALTCCKIGGEWVVSDNIVQYKNGAANQFIG